MPMRVVMIPSWYPSAETPFHGIFLKEQAQCLGRRFDMTVLTPRFPPLRDQATLRFGPRCIREKADGIETWRIRHLKIPTLRKWIPGLRDPDHALVYYRKFAAAIRRGFEQYVAERGLPDLIHAHVVFPAGWVAVELAQTYRVPIVLTEHSGPFTMHLATPRQRALVHDILHRADRVVAVSPALAGAMNQFVPDVPIDVIGNWIDTDYFTPSAEARAVGPFRFFYLGVFVEVKGVRHLLEAVRRLRDQGMGNFELHLGGDGPLCGELKRMAIDLDIARECKFLGMLQRHLVREQMRACDVFILPSLAETFGIVVGEAMACGKPVLSTRCGGPEFTVTPQTGILVPPGDAAALAAAMADYLTRRTAFDPARIRASTVERFGADAFHARHAAIYSEVASRAPIKQAG